MQKIVTVKGYVRKIKGGKYLYVKPHQKRVLLSRGSGFDTKFQVAKAGTRFYKVADGTYYHIDTSDEMIGILERIRKNQTRVRFHWGDTKTGADWGDMHDVEGTIGRSPGWAKIPLLIYSRRSFGGGGILTDSIVKIVTSKGKRLIYQHPKYHLKKR